MNKSEEIKELLGESFHTAFRKAISSGVSNRIWNLIRILPNEEWDAVLDFVYECIKEYLEK